jgi:hypothetical protein
MTGKKITIGKNFLGYAQKHSAMGTAKKPREGWKPVAGLTNKAAHSGSRHVLSDSGIRRSVEFGLRKTVKWYQKTLAAIDRKKS